MRAATLSALLLLPVVCQEGGPLGEDEFEPDESLGSPTTLGSSVADDLSSQARLAEFLADDEKMRAINRRIEEGDHGFDPFYVEAYGQVDASASYEFSNGVTIFGEAINLLNEDRRGHRRADQAVYFAAPGHARYTAGLRFTW